MWKPCLLIFIIVGLECDWGEHIVIGHRPLLVLKGKVLSFSIRPGMSEREVVRILLLPAQPMTLSRVTQRSTSRLLERRSSIVGDSA